jgi:hypothetical protein
MEKLLWTRRGFIKGVAAFAGAGMLQPVLPLIGDGKSIAAAYPEEVLSIEKYTKGKVKVGMIITSDNADLVKDIAPDGLYVELKRGGRIKITETTLNPDAVNFHSWNVATVQNQGQAVLDKKGQLFHKNGGPWIGGAPFPEPKTGIEAVWNFKFNPRRYDDLKVASTQTDVDSTGKNLRRSELIYMQIQCVGRLDVDPRPVDPLHKNELHRTSLMVNKPFDVYGLNVATTVYYDATKMPDTDLYVPTLKRTRRVPSTQRFESAAPYAVYFVSDLDIHNDPVLMWTWKLTGSKPMLGPSPLNIGGRFKNPTKEDFVFPSLEPPLGFPPQSYELRPEMFLVDGVPNLPGAPYKMKRMYIDGIYQRAQMSDIWDLAGKLWKLNVYFTGDTGLRFKGYQVCDLTGMLVADLQKNYHSNITFYNEFGNMKFSVNSGFRIEDYMTQSAMLKLATK